MKHKATTICRMPVLDVEHRTGTNVEGLTFMQWARSEPGRRAIAAVVSQLRARIVEEGALPMLYDTLVSIPALVNHLVNQPL